MLPWYMEAKLQRWVGLLLLKRYAAAQQPPAETTMAVATAGTAIWFIASPPVSGGAIQWSRGEDAKPIDLKLIGVGQAAAKRSQRTSARPSSPVMRPTRIC